MCSQLAPVPAGGSEAGSLGASKCRLETSGLGQSGVDSGPWMGAVACSLGEWTEQRTKKKTQRDPSPIWPSVDSRGWA